MSSIDTSRSSASIVAEVIDNGSVSGQQLLVIGLCFIFNMLDGFDIEQLAKVELRVEHRAEIARRLQHYREGRSWQDP